MNRTGCATILFPKTPSVVSYAAHVGKKEKEGPLAACFSEFDLDTTFGQESWEMAETELQRRAFESATRCSDTPDIIFGGDLLNQCVAASHAAMETAIPFAGLYGACSTMAETLCFASLLVDGGYSRCAAAITSSHFCAAERQFRFPLEYGGQRTGQAQWTVTGAGCCVLGPHRNGKVSIHSACLGRVVDFGVTDINNMGAAMAPAAADTLLSFFKDTETGPESYDLILTGDLGAVGTELLHKILGREGVALENHKDCGLLIYDRIRQKAGSGGSGCGCSASVLTGWLLPRMERRELHSVLFVATGALMSPTTFQQGNPIPSVAHLVELRI